MERKRAFLQREWYELVADGALITAGTFSLFTGIVLLITGVAIKGAVPVWLELASAGTVFLGGVAGPVLTWLVHGRTITVSAVVGALLSGPVVGALFFIFVALSTALGWVLSGVNDAEWFGPLVAAGLVAAGFFAICVWLIIDAARDVAPSRRRHHRVDQARMASAAVLVVYAATIVAFALRPGAGEVIEALAFMLMAALAGACAVGLADIVQRFLRMRTVESASVDTTVRPG